MHKSPGYHIRKFCNPPLAYQHALSIYTSLQHSATIQKKISRCPAPACTSFPFSEGRTPLLPDDLSRTKVKNSYAEVLWAKVMNFWLVGLPSHPFKLVIAKTFCVILCIYFLQVPWIAKQFMSNYGRQGFKNGQIVGRKVRQNSVKKLRGLFFHDEFINSR